MDPLTILLVGGGLAWLVWLATHRQNKVNKLMRTLDIKNKDGRYPHLLDYDESERVETYVLWVPDGIPYELFVKPESKVHQAIKQSLGDMRRIEVIPISGHKIAVRVIKEELGFSYPLPLEEIRKSAPMTFALGESLAGSISLKMGDEAPHLCIAGTTGGGKTYLLKSLILQCILKPKRIDVAIIDLKGGADTYMFEKCERVIMYARTVGEGEGVLKRLQVEMERRYDLFSRVGASNIDKYNKKASPRLRRIFLFVDEFAGFSDKKFPAAQEILKDLLRRARASGIHVCVDTQHPTTDVINTQIKANMPAFIAFLTATQSNSITILGHGGAELLPGHGRGILRAPGMKEVEFQGYDASETVCEELVRHTYVTKPEEKPQKKGVIQTWQ
jgi:hypothetical protein